MLHARNQLNMAVCSENASSLQLRSLETTIAVLKSKRPRALALEQKQDILVAYHSLQAGDSVGRPRTEAKGKLPTAGSCITRLFGKKVGLVYRDWHHQLEI